MINFENRLKSLKDRRQGTRERILLEKGYNSWDSGDYRTRESYEALTEANGVKYAIGAMAAVSQQSTDVSVREGNRVADTLISSLSTAGISATKRLQGSVALDVHIEGHSDVDMLIILTSTVQVQMPTVDGSTCFASDKRSMEDIIRELRLTSEVKLTSRYPEATVNCNGNKSIALEGGSLQRKVDIVPSCWYNSHAYQHSNQEFDRGVKIYNKQEHKLLLNWPFLHIKRVNDRDNSYSGNLKRVVRLMKNMIADMPDYKKRVAKKLSSYDLAAIGYQMDKDLNLPTYMTLGLVEKTRENLSMLVLSQRLRDLVMVPDGSRKIFDSEDKFEALKILESEMDDLAKSIFKELRPFATTYESSTLTDKAIF
ncbi:hypothetical protein J8Z28_03875 [Pseudoalteromonas sp. SCSIO 43088]|uniref:hypothetical protein n=1 Tax=Pseudoalteromonas sp. SCSIO 43088 TaxID=2822846 RepID=UPI00202AC35C|nr:hypothetical protein [Pseudoalteromonas sp. SCSIO 43088]URQ87044.1 hypothetical protein J8Z28_03875 [Pseudoalteromonas sp. SCSIO 43088]